jgi:hypothetical protein
METRKMTNNFRRRRGLGWFGWRPGAAGLLRFAVGGDFVDWGEDRLRGGDVAQPASAVGERDAGMRPGAMIDERERIKGKRCSEPTCYN